MGGNHGYHPSGGSSPDREQGFLEKAQPVNRIFLTAEIKQEKMGLAKFLTKI
jgi:hypothetical protein